ncbi:hypothetical protein Tco_1241425, partial [Tanacetum coccineum]
MAQQQQVIPGQLLVDHALSYALTATTNVPDVYLQQFWKTIRLVVNANEKIRFMVDKKEITYTVDMFRSTLKLLVETPENPFVALANMKFIQPLLKIVRYQGDADKVGAFYTKYLAQPWKTMFKVLNHFLTSRTYVHDQTKINILQIFHDEVNRVNVDYVGLLWWDFLHYIQQKKDVIQYPCFTKLILVDLMKKFDSIPQRLKEDYHSINDDIPLVSVYTMRNMTVRGMLISDEFLTDDIRTPEEYKEYEKVFVKKKRKRMQVSRETSSPKPSLKIRVKQMKPSTTPIPPPSNDKERDEIAEATLLSLT